LEPACVFLDPLAVVGVDVNFQALQAEFVAAGAQRGDPLSASFHGIAHAP
jgi:hypothetical protein